MDSTTEELKRALELDRDGDWDTAHGIVQRFNTPDACWIHAYLHREEGDLGNSGYWYRRANKTMPIYALEQEWSELYGYITGKLGSLITDTP
jgi:hypothetical protein